jgi:transposase-like protein
MTRTSYARKGGLPETPGGKPRKSIRFHEHRDQIEYALATGQSVRAIAKKFGVHETSLYRHRKLHLPPQLRQAYIGQLLKPGVDLDKLKTEESEGLLQSLATQRARLLLAQDKALEESDGQLGSKLINFSTATIRS